LDGMPPQADFDNIIVSVKEKHSSKSNNVIDQSKYALLQRRIKRNNDVISPRFIFSLSLARAFSPRDSE